MGKLVLITLVLFSITAVYNEVIAGGTDNRCCQPDNRPVAAIDS